MQILQRLYWLPATPIQSYFRHYSKKPKIGMANNRRMVHQELLRYVNPCARINIKSDISVLVEPADVHVHTSGNVFIAQLLGGPVSNCKATLDVDVCDDDKVVNVLVKKLTEPNSHFKCHVKIPVQAEVHIDADAKVTVQGIQGVALKIKASGDIVTKNVRATDISLHSENGNIICEGTLLGKCTEIETHNGNINLDKLQGDSLKCSTQAGDINTDCCYVEKSKFETTTGRMELKNVHKTSEVYVHQSGDLKMTGVHGNLSVVTKGGSMNLQLSELNGKSEIVAQNLIDEAIINISEAIENITIEVKASQVNLNNELEHVSHALSEDKSKFLLNNGKEHHLVISSTGENGVRLGKQSWTDSLRQKIKLGETN
ncbi:protein FAM185A [Drosophila novamexicana]|uniref:protein FAM185A n=1 Tax=Drosophila novamexicana TaxID=47314 RepID=UPI0011E5D186|nr:protein FAM185A [Drosophila novamexicana]